jgi:hypothetical protein
MPDSDKLARQRGVDDAGGGEAVLQAGVLVVEHAQLRQFGADRVHCSTMAARPAASRSTATPPGTMRSIRKRWPKSCWFRRTHCSLRAQNWVRPKAKAASLPSAPRSPRWLATRSRSSIRARSIRARGGGATPQAASTGVGIGPGVGAGGIAGDAADQLRAAREVGADEQLLDALVLVAEALFEAQHALADDREAEMARLDDAGVDGADGDLVGALAADLDEVVVGRRVGKPPGGSARRGAADTSRPASRRGAARGAGRRLRWRCRPCRAWRAACGWRRGRCRQVGVTRGVFRQVEASQAWPWSMPKTHCRRKPSPSLRRSSLAPDRADAPAGEVHRQRRNCAGPRRSAHGRATPARRPGLAREFDGGVVEKEHVQLSMRAASWNQRVR